MKKLAIAKTEFHSGKIKNDVNVTSKNNVASRLGALKRKLGALKAQVVLMGDLGGWRVVIKSSFILFHLKIYYQARCAHTKF